jgi:hypothetical protein
VLWIRIRKVSHHFGNLNPHPDPHQIKIRIRISYRSDKLDPEPDPDSKQFANDEPERIEYEPM